VKFKANFVEKPGNFQMDDCQIEKVVELTHEEFCKLKITPMEEQPFITENKSCMYSRDGILHCLLALGPNSNDGILIEAAGYDYPRLAAYIPGMRDIVNAEMDRAAEFIVRQAVENTTSGSWCVYFEELEEKLGLTIRERNGFDSMLRLALKCRPEVASVDMHDGCIETEYRPEYCRQLNSGAEDERSGLRLKELLPLLTGHGAIFLRCEEAETSVLAEDLRQLTEVGRKEHAALFDAQVFEIRDTPEGTEVVLTNVELKELERFNEAYDAFMEAEQAMGPVM